jgi:AcrR family transcriptional regulator
VPDADPLPAPQQARSRAALGRLLGAVEGTIAERGVANLTVQEVAGRAGLAVGTLYTRFPGKDALLRAFTIAFFDRARRAADTLLDDARWRRLPPRELVGGVVRALVKSYRAKRGLLRALHLYVRGHSDTAFQAQAAAFNAEFVRRLTVLLLQHREAMAHPEPERGVLLGFLMVDAAAKEAILFDDARPPDFRVSDDELIETLTRAYSRLLDLSDGGSGR